MADSIQSVFLDQVKETLPPHLSFVDDLAELLSISRDSVYRRIRGETLLSLEEVQKICTHYNVSLDALLAPTDETMSFHHRRIDNQHFSFQKWMHSILGNLEMICGFPEKEVWYAAKDVPPFHYFNYPDLSAFKMYFWMKNYHQNPDLENVNFTPDLIPRELIAVGKRIWDRYREIPSVEIWSDETPIVTLRQVEYTHQTGSITTDQAHKVLDQFKIMNEQIQADAKAGHKGQGSYGLFKNEILISSSTILFKMGDKRVSFLVYNAMDTLSTSQETFCNNSEKFFQNLFSKSVQMSASGEKERNRFFKLLNDNVEKSRSKLN